MGMIGQKLKERYEIREHLGDGSTATVYKALDQVLKRDVALKILLPHVRETTHRRFFQEATAAAHLNHANIMSIFDIAEDNGRHFLVTEFVEGDPLTHYIPCTPEVLVNLGTQIAEALQYAHDREIIHRDIKPANIKVTPEGKVKIMDLGLALPREAKRVTAAGMVIGTPAYLSPEQAQGHKLDNRTDIYSLGIVLYEMATGQLPFNADDITALLLQQVKQPPPPPRLIVSDLPIAMEQVILKALEKDPNRRYQTCEALANGLQEALSSGERSTTPRRPDNWGERLKTGNLSPDMLEGVAAPDAKPVKQINIILADDHTILRKTLANFLESQEGLVVIDQVGTADDALEQTVAQGPDVLVLDLNMPGKNGLDVLPEIRAQAPDTKVLVLTGRGDDAYIVRALRAGAHGYVLKTDDEHELVASIHKVLDGQLVLGKGVTETVVSGLLNPVDDDKQLNDAERKVLMHIAAGYETDAIAYRLDLSVPEVIETMARAMDKLEARDRHAAALKALREGHITLEDLQDISTGREE